VTVESITFNPAKMLKSIAALGGLSGDMLQLLVYDQMRLWAIDALRMTPPSGAGWKKKGTKRVKADLNKLFVGVRSDVYRAYMDRLEAKGVARIPQGGGYRNLRQAQMLTKTALKPTHQGHRNRKGRVRYKGASGDAFKGRFLVSRAGLSKYRRQVLGRVGMSKKGWTPSIIHFARLSRASTSTGIPKAVLKSKGDARGRAEGALRRDGSGRIASVNENPWMKYKMGLSGFAIIKAKRERDITRQLSKRISTLTKRFNSGAV
jgi:hypothetical protein